MPREDTKELAEILDGGAVSAVSLAGIEILRSLLAVITIGFIGGSGYGIVSSIQRSATTARFVFGGLFTALKRSLPRYEKEDQNSLVVVSVLVLFGAVTVIIGVLILIADQIIATTFLETWNLFTMALLYGFMFIVLLFLGELLKAYKEIRTANIVMRWAAPGFQIFGIIVVASLWQASIIGVLVGMTGGVFAALCLGCMFLWTRTPLSLMQRSDDLSIIRSYGNYLGPAAIASALIGIQFGGYNLMMFSLSTVEAGVFGISLILATITRLPLNAINQIFPQVASELYDVDGTDRIQSLYQSTSKLALFASIPIGIVVSVFHQEIAGLFASSYQQFSLIIPLMAIAQVMAVLAGTVGFLLMMTDNERKSMLLQIGLTSITLFVIIGATDRFGVFGLAGAYFFGYTFNNISELFLLHHLEGLHPFTLDHAGLLFLGLVHGMVLYGLTMVSFTIGIIGCIGTLGSYGVIGYRLYIEKTEKRAIKTCIGTLGSRLK